MASSNAYELQGSRMRARPKQIQGMAWVLHGVITPDQLLVGSDSADGVDGLLENEDKALNLKSQLLASLGDEADII